MIYFTFGRFNPPTTGHQKLLRQLLWRNHIVFLSQTQDKKKNPLDWKTKLDYMKKMFPKINFCEDTSIRTPFEAIKYLSTDHCNVTMMVGHDQVNSFTKMIYPYLNNPTSNDPIYLHSFKIISAGDRYPDEDTIEGISSTKMRMFVQQNKKRLFNKYCPTLNKTDKSKLFEQLKSSLL